MTIVIDASALLIVLLGERGAEQAVEASKAGLISTVNLAEVYQKAEESGVSVPAVSTFVRRLEIAPVDFTERLAIRAAQLRPVTRHLGLSLADRACIALAMDRELPILTADRAWSGLDLGIDIRLIR